MTWKATFDKGVACFKRGDLGKALTYMNEAAELERSNFIIYDSRAAVHEKLGDIKAALLDSKRVIDLAPGRWQGYARSARLFDLLGKHGHVIKMVDHALNHLRPEDVQRRTSLVELREKAIAAQVVAEKQVAKTSYLLGKLPVETLVGIFTSLIDEDHTWAVKLSHVCGHWRRILINTPSAWQTLVLSRRHPLQKAKLWKERAKNRISRLSVDVSELDRDSIFALLQDLFWDHLSCLSMSSKAFADLYRTLSCTSQPYTFPKLDELALFGCESSEGSYCHSSPNRELKILRLSGVVGILAGWPTQIQQLKELHLNGSVAHSIVPVLVANPLLEKLVLDCQIVGHSSSDLDDTGPTSMDSLKVIECRGVAQPSDVLHGISAPSITHFTMVSATQADEPLLHFASCASLVQLHIGRCSLSSSTLPAVLSSTPNLETLRVNSIQAVVNEVFAFLAPTTVDPQRGLPCRALKHIDVSQCSDLTTSSTYALIKIRMKYASNSIELAVKCADIASLNVDGCPNIEPEMLPWFRSKVAQFTCVYATKKNFAKNRRREL